jgi:hypothetical protein
MDSLLGTHLELGSHHDLDRAMPWEDIARHWEETVKDWEDIVRH